MKSIVSVVKYIVGYRENYPNNFREVRYAVMFAEELETIRSFTPMVFGSTNINEVGHVHYMHFAPSFGNGLFGYTKKIYCVKVPPRCKQYTPLYSSKFERKAIYR